VSETLVSPTQSLEWLRERAFPLWLSKGVDWKAGAFMEDLDPATMLPRARFRRLRVAARQIYSFAQAEKLGVAGAADAVALGLDFLKNRARQPDGGFAMRFDLEGAVIDQTRDLYDHAFVLLAFTHAGERQAAAAMMDYIESEFAHPARGFRESTPDSAPRRQNPHMHLLEALLAAGERFGDTRYLDAADRIIDLFLSHFFQHDTHGLAEFYDDALAPVRHDGRFVVEPGHHHEWVWLLDEHRRISALTGRMLRDSSAPAAALMAFAERHGVRDDGIIAGELWSDGAVKQAATRVWPHTERIKAVARCKPSSQGAAVTALFRFFDDVPGGLWRERWANGFVPGEPAPASTLYHITCAIMEIQPRLA
jgi:mannose-6-phosphate isomerase